MGHTNLDFASIFFVKTIIYFDLLMLISRHEDQNKNCISYLFAGYLHPIPRLPRLLLPVQEPERLPQPHRDGPVEEPRARGADEHRVHGLGTEHPARQDQEEGINTF